MLNIFTCRIYKGCTLEVDSLIPLHEVCEELLGKGVNYMDVAFNDLY